MDSDDEEMVELRDKINEKYSRMTKTQQAKVGAELWEEAKHEEFEGGAVQAAFNMGRDAGHGEDEVEWASKAARAKKYSSQDFRNAVEFVMERASCSEELETIIEAIYEVRGYPSSSESEDESA